MNALQWWTVPANLAVGCPFTAPPPTVTVTKDASKEGWGVNTRVLGVDAPLFSNLWSPEERLLHINVLGLMSHDTDADALEAETP